MQQNLLSFKILVVEIMYNGDLKSVLCKMRPTYVCLYLSLANRLLLITYHFIQRSEQSVMDNVPMQLLNFSKQVAMGLHYLSCKGFIHRDLAARNILVSKDNICKVYTVGPLITDPPRSGQLPNSGHYSCYGLKLL